MSITFTETANNEISAPACAPYSDDSSPKKLQGIVRWFNHRYGVIKVPLANNNEFDDYFVYGKNAIDKLYDALEVVFDGYIENDKKIAKCVKYLPDSNINKEILYKINKTDLHFDTAYFAKQGTLSKLYNNQVKLCMSYFKNRKLYDIAKIFNEMSWVIDFNENPTGKFDITKYPNMIRRRGPLDYTFTFMGRLIDFNPSKEIQSSSSVITYNYGEYVIMLELNVENVDGTKYKVINVIGRAMDVKLVHNYSNVKTMIRMKHSHLLAFGNDVVNDWTIKYNLFKKD